jgi:prepilin-type N-terminal cleavage/methylation domain-containing protein
MKLLAVNYSLQTNRGFTLIEIAIAIFVLTVGILAIYALVPKSVSVGMSNVNSFIASQLAEEGIEIVRNFRDTNWIEGKAWTDGLTQCSSGCEVDYDDTKLSTSGPSHFLKIDNNGFYNYEIGADTKFKRKITITTPSATSTLVGVEVSGFGQGSPFIIKENLYDWK